MVTFRSFRQYKIQIHNCKLHWASDWVVLIVKNTSLWFKQPKGLSEIKIKNTEILLDVGKEVYLEMNAEEAGSKNVHVWTPEYRTGL